MANIAYLPGPLDPSNPLLNQNSLIQNVDANTGGVVASIGAPVTTTGTSANTALSYTVPGNSWLPGQVFRVRGWGVNSADVNAKTITVALGALTQNAVVTGSGQAWEFEALFQNVGSVASPAQSEVVRAISAATVVTTGAPANNTQALTGPLNLVVQLTAATAGTMTLNGCLVEKVM